MDGLCLILIALNGAAGLVIGLGLGAWLSSPKQQYTPPSKRSGRMIAENFDRHSN